MPTIPPSRQFHAASLDDVIRKALSALFPNSGTEDVTTLVFSGEGPTPAAAVTHALDDIRDLGQTHAGTPARAELEGWLRTDTGFRLWGTLGIIPQAEPYLHPSPDITLTEQEEGQWTLTIHNP